MRRNIVHDLFLLRRPPHRSIVLYIRQLFAKRGEPVKSITSADGVPEIMFFDRRPVPDRLDQVLLELLFRVYSRSLAWPWFYDL